MLQPKDTDWMNGYKNKTHMYAIYKKPTSQGLPPQSPSQQMRAGGWAWGWEGELAEEQEEEKEVLSGNSIRCDRKPS